MRIGAPSSARTARPGTPARALVLLERVEQLDEAVFGLVEHDAVEPVRVRDHLAPRERRELAAGGEVAAIAARTQRPREAEELRCAVLELDAEADDVGPMRERLLGDLLGVLGLVERDDVDLVTRTRGDRCDHAHAEVLLEVGAHDDDAHVCRCAPRARGDG
ncbi:MAG: hypothetical protein M5U28_46795 [Sandaracinaceae bacterium]|nr:hypothetical protein [Sandaracinaceae bacterium]